VIVVVRHANDWHAAIEAEKLTQPSWGFKSLLQLVAVEGRGVTLERQVQACGKFLQNGPKPRGDKQRVIVGRETSDDPLGANAQPLHNFSQRFERCARVGVGMLSAREALFLIVADDPGTTSRSHLDECNSRVVESADTYASEVGRFAASQSCDQVPCPGGSKLAVRTMNVFVPEVPFCKR
jgi:hypothetical protein